jgi:glycosyltransferase involved in cell wall biosynthesis
MKQRIKLLLLIPHLGGGGAERVTAQLARHLDPARFETHLALITADGPGAELPPHWVTVHRFGLTRVRQAWLQLIRLIRQLRPEVVLSGMAHLNFLILALKPLLPHKTRILVRQNATASSAANSWHIRTLYCHLYSKADLVICQSQAMADDLERNFAIKPEKLVVLANPIDIPSIPAAPSHAAFPTLLSVARLSREKGIDLLVEALAILQPQHPNLKLTILGTGPEESNLRQLALTFGVTESVHFAGHANPAEYFPNATLFVLPSRHEGMPNALLEAAAAGLPIVATPCSEGIIERIEAQPGTWLAEAISAQALAAAISKALTTRPNRLQHEFIAPFKTETALAAYSALITRITDPAKSPNHIAMLIPTIDQIGGAERQVLLLAQGLAARDWRVTVIALSGAGGTHVDELARSGIAYHSLAMRKAWIDPRGWLRYRQWARKNNPGIVHTHLPHATWFARCIRPFAPGHVLIDTIHTSKVGGRAQRLTYRLTSPLTNQITCVSQSVANAGVRAHMIPKGKLTVIPNGVILPETRNVDRPESDQFRWIAVGRLAPVKDYPTLLKALAQLPESAHLTILGTGPQEPSLRTLAAQLKIADRIEFAGFQPSIEPWLAGADAFVLASLWEGLPVSVLEASASGLPIVATDGLGTREAMLPDQSGLLVPVADPSALAAAMSRIMSMPAAKRRAMGETGRKFVAETYSLPIILDKWEALYSQFLDRNPEPLRTSFSFE